MDIRDLRAFYLASKYGLFLSSELPESLVRQFLLQLKKLEDELRIRLFERQKFVMSK